MSKSPPEETLRDGNLKAAIWRNEGENGPYWSVTLAKTYKDERGAYQDTQSFSGTDLLRVAELSRDAYARTNELRREHFASQERTGRPAEAFEQRTTQERPRTRDRSRTRQP